MESTYCKTKIIFLTIVFFITTIFCSLAQDFTITFIEEPYRDPGPMFMELYFDGGGEQIVSAFHYTINGFDTVSIGIPIKQIGFGMSFFSAVPENTFQFGMLIGGRIIYTSNILVPNLELTNVAEFDFMLGGVFFPGKHLLGIGNLSIRPKASAMGGLSGLGFGAHLAAGLAFSRKDNPSGLLMEYVYRPFGYNKISEIKTSCLYCDPEKFKFIIDPSWALRFAFFFGK